MGGEANSLWATAFLGELAASGVEHVAVAPGSRSTPLVLAAAADSRLETTVHVDERSAAFFALGIGKATGIPAAVITTSGTATANLFPAVIEAHYGGVPLIVLTADRPHRLRDVGANQAIDQVGLYGSHVRWFAEVAPPTAEDGALRHLRAQAARAVAHASVPDAGPVHLNFPFDKPLEPVSSGGAASDLTAGREGHDGLDVLERPAVRITRGARSAVPTAVERLSEALRASPRGLVVAGPMPRSDAAAVLRLAAATGFPLLADPLSGARFGDPGGASVIANYDLVLQDREVRARLDPQIIVRVGRTPTSAATCLFMGEVGANDQIVINHGGGWKDHLAVATEVVEAEVAPFLDALTSKVTNTIAPPEWRDRWTRLDALAGTVRDGLDRENILFEGDVVADTLAVVPEGTNLFVSNSMPVRDLDGFGGASQKTLRVFGNRGASGIDGIVSTALGIAAGGVSIPDPAGRAVPASGEPLTVAVLGDVAFLHDQNGLLAARKYGLNVIFLVIQNDGGGIFHSLPIRDFEPAFTPYFAAPHGLNFRHIAALHSLPYQLVVEAGHLRAALKAVMEVGGPALLEVQCDRDENQQMRHRMSHAVSTAVLAELN